MNRKKRGISGVVVTILLIFLSIVAVLIVWGIISPMIKKQAGEIGDTGTVLSTTLSLRSVQVSMTDVQVSVKREGSSSLNGLKIIVDGEKGSYVKQITDAAQIPGDLETKSYTFSFADTGKVKSVSVAPIFSNNKLGVVDKEDVSYSDVTLPSGLVGWWKLDGDATDSSGNGNDGNVVGSPTYETGKVGKGININGGKYVTIPNSATMENVQEGEYTLSAWYKPNSPNNGDPTGSILVKSGWHSGLMHEKAATRCFFNKWFGTPASPDQIAAGYNSCTLGNFWHIIGVSNIENGKETIRIYINGELKQTSIYPGTKSDWEYGTNMWGIGIAPVVNNYRADGIIDEVMIFNKPLSADEVKQLYTMQA